MLSTEGERVSVSAPNRLVESTRAFRVRRVAVAGFPRRMRACPYIAPSRARMPVRMLLDPGGARGATRREFSMKSVDEEMIRTRATRDSERPTRSALVRKTSRARIRPLRFGPYEIGEVIGRGGMASV